MPAQIVKTLITLTVITLLQACSNAYYAGMEKFGVYKRDILIDRIEEAQDAQQEGQQQFKDALEQFKSVVSFDGGDLEKLYERMNDEYEDAESAAEEISARIDSVDKVAEDLFDEWRSELEQYTNPSFKRDISAKLKDTERRYKKLLAAMRRAEKSIKPVLDTLRDNKLYLKHNLNARAISSLKSELGSINNNVNQLIGNMERAIEESDSFIQQLKQG